jgi:phenylacetate-CoA ligase
VASGLRPRLVYSLKDAFTGRNVTAVLEELKASERLPRAQLEELQAERLRRILRHAYDHVPYYRALFQEHGLDPGRVRGPADLARLPILTKAIVRARRRELMATDRGTRHTQTAYTSGSTGEPASFVLDASEMSHRLANQLRGRSWFGLAIGEPEVKVWDDPRNYVGRRSRAHVFWTANALKDRLLNIRLVPATDLAHQSLARWERLVRRIRPTVVYGYGSSIYCFARYLRGRGVAPAALGVRIVMVTSELLLPAQKQLIAGAFSAPVVEEYGSGECGIIAFECPHGALHTSDETLVLEVADPGADGSGALLVTMLQNYTMPLIRYSVGDLVVPSSEPCACGRGLGVLGKVLGRTTDVLVSSAGEHVHPFQLMHVLQRFDKIARYRVVQRSAAAVELMAQVDSPLDEAEVARVRGAFRDALGEGVDVAIHYVDSMPPGPGGKHSFLVSLVSDGAEGLGPDNHAE